MKKLALLLDNTGSMSSYSHEVKNFLSQLSALLASKDATFYGRLFETSLNGRVYTQALSLSHAYQAGGGPTGICNSLDEFLDSLGQQHGFQPTDKVLAIVVTDGKDDRYSADTAKGICERVRIMETALRWDWLFVGTDTAAIAYSAKLGIKPGKTLQMTNNHEGFQAALDSLLHIVNGWAEDKISGDEFFSEQDRTAQTVASGQASKVI